MKVSSMKCFPKLLLLLFAAAVLTVSGRAQDAPDVVAVAVEEVVEAVADETPSMPAWRLLPSLLPTRCSPPTICG